MSVKKSAGPKKIVFLILAGLVVCAGAWLYYMIYMGNVELGNKKVEYFYVRSTWKYEDVVNALEEKKLIKSRSSFEWVAKLKKYKQQVKPGRYRLTESMSNSSLVNMLRRGDQDPVHFTLNAVRTKEQLASRVGGKLEADSITLLHLLNDDGYLNRFGMTSANIMSLFIPETYEFMWTSTPEQFMDRMAKEYKKFWTDDRKERAKAIDLSQSQVMILASIVQEEQTRFPEERPMIAGVYMNRLREHMRLQSDPTFRYALGEFDKNRFSDSDTKVDSPYNTYLHKGLPPGPICFPDAASVDAVLNYKKHNYLYFCAEYGTGHHLFAVTYDEHEANARKYHEALDKAGIKH
ncbi:MAG: endolytic transglycosylase MltG [Bacteroidia bacterium]